MGHHGSVSARARIAVALASPAREIYAAVQAATRSDAALASVSAQSARDLRRLAPLLQRCDPPAFADGLSMDRVLEPLEERFKLVDPLLQNFDAPLMPRSSCLGGRVRGPPAATQLDDAAEDRRATPRATTGIAGTRHGGTLPLPLLLEAAREEEEARPNERCRPHWPARLKDYSPATCPQVGWLPALLPSMSFSESQARHRSERAGHGAVRAPGEWAS